MAGRSSSSGERLPGIFRRNISQFAAACAGWESQVRQKQIDILCLGFHQELSGPGPIGLHHPIAIALQDVSRQVSNPVVSFDQQNGATSWRRQGGLLNGDSLRD